MDGKAKQIWSERDRKLGLEHFWDGLHEDKLGETIDFTNKLSICR